MKDIPLWHHLLGKPRYLDRVQLNPVHPLNRGLSVFLLFNERARSTVVNCVNGQVYTNAIVTWSREGVYFPADLSKYINIGTAIDVSSNYFSTVLKIFSFDGLRQTILGCNNSASGYQFETGSGPNNVDVIINGVFIAVTATGSVMPLNWHTVVHTKVGAGSTNHIYVDGIELGLTTNAGNSFANAPYHEIGRRTTISQASNNVISFLAFYPNRVLTLNEVIEWTYSPFGIVGCPRFIYEPRRPWAMPAAAPTTTGGSLIGPNILVGDRGLVGRSVLIN